MESLVGTWKMVSSDNFDEYMKSVGKTVFTFARRCGVVVLNKNLSSSLTCNTHELLQRF